MRLPITLPPLHPLVALAAVLALAVLAYWPGLPGDFEFDDLATILHNSAIAVERLDYASLRDASLSGAITGPLGRPIAMVSFALNHYFSGFSPLAYKLTNLAIHLVNGLLVYALAHGLMLGLRAGHGRDIPDRRARWLAVAAAALWLLHPLNLTSVLYIVQRMTSLAALFTFAAAACYVSGRLRLIDGRRAWALTLLAPALLGGLAALSKETGLLLPVLLLAIEVTVFRFRMPDPTGQRLLIGIYLATVGLPLVVAAAYLLRHPDWLPALYSTRPFTLGERLLTEARAIWFYLGQTAYPEATRLGLHHDDFVLSRSLTEPVTTLAAVAGLAGLVLVALAGLRRAPMLAFGIVWFLAGHLLESTVLPLEPVYEHRNYLPLFGPLLAVAYYLLVPPIGRVSISTRASVATLIILTLALVTALRADEWHDLAEHAKVEAIHHPQSERAQYQAGRVYFMLYERNRHSPFNMFWASDFFRQATVASAPQHGIAGPIGLIQLYFFANQAITPELLADLKRRLQLRTLQFGDIHLLLGLMNCQLAGTCRLPDPYFLELLDAARTNPSATAALIANTRHLEARYRLRKLGDHAGAEAALRHAAAVRRREPLGHLELGQLYVETGRLQEAEAALERARALDRNGVLREQIAEAQQALAAASQRVQSGLPETDAEPQ
jgi:hypothetical protein